MRARSALCFVLLTLLPAPCAWGMRSPSRDVSISQVKREPGKVWARREMMNTQVDITIYAEDRKVAREAVTAAFEEMAVLERQLSRHVPGSDVSRCNLDAARKPIRVSEHTFAILEAAGRYAAVTGGAFDVTVTPYLALWRDGARKGIPPAAASLADAGRSVGSRLIELDRETRTVRFARPGVQIDLGGIAKGYIVDQAIGVLKKAGVKSAIVNAGGDLSVLGTKPGGDAWSVGIQDPRRPESTQNLIAVVQVSDRAVATSGNYRRFSVIGGKRISHILDARTGRPAEAVPSVTIMAPDALTGDALATGVSVLGVEKGLALVNAQEGIEALLVTVEGEELKLHRSKGFPLPGKDAEAQRQLLFQITY